MNPDRPMLNATLRPNLNHSSQLLHRKDSGLTQNFLLVWLDANIDEAKKHFQHSLAKLRTIVRSLKTFTNPERCVQYLKTIKKEKIFLIVSGSLGQTHVPLLHDMNQLDSIFVFCRDVPRHEQWARKWPKVQLVTTSISSICERMKRVARDCDHHALPMVFVGGRSSASPTPLEHPDQLDPSFLYSLLFKEIALEIEYNDQKAIETLLDHCREQKIPETQLELFRNEFRQHSPIWWYTDDSFPSQHVEQSIVLL